MSCPEKLDSVGSVARLPSGASGYITVVERFCLYWADWAAFGSIPPHPPRIYFSPVCLPGLRLDRRWPTNNRLDALPTTKSGTSARFFSSQERVHISPESAQSTHFREGSIDPKRRLPDAATRRQPTAATAVAAEAQRLHFVRGGHHCVLCCPC